MKVFVALLVLAACVYAEVEWNVNTNAEMNRIRLECAKEYPLSHEQTAKIEDLEFPNEEAVRNNILCTAENIGIFSSDEGYDADRIVKQFKMDMEEEEVKKLVEECIAKHPKGDKPNDVAAYEAHICFMSTAIGDRIKDYIKKRQEAAAKQTE